MIEYKCKEVSPCRYCEQRAAGCHSNCEKYQKWREILTEEKKMFWEHEGTNIAFKGIMSEHKEKQIKKGTRRRK